LTKAEDKQLQEIALSTGGSVVCVLTEQFDLNRLLLMRLPRIALATPSPSAAAALILEVAPTQGDFS
jgi:hypothetical protein